MKLAAKLLFFIIMCVVAVLAVYGYFNIRSEIGRIQREMKQDAELIGDTLKGLFTDVWNKSGRERALELLEDANRSEHLVRIRWVPLTAAQDASLKPLMDPVKLAPLYKGERVVLEGRDPMGVKALFMYIPLDLEDGTRCALELSEPLSVQDQYIRRYLGKMVLLTAALILFTGLLVLFLGFWLVGRPVKRLIEKARRMGAGDLTDPLSLHGRDEISELAREINDMCEQLIRAQAKIESETAARISALEQLRHADRLKTTGRLASGIAHELGTPLNVVSGRAGLMAKGNLSKEDVVKGAEIIKTQAERMAGIIRQFLDFARRRAPKKASSDLCQIARQAGDLLAPMGKKTGCTIDLLGLDRPAMAAVDAGQIQQVLANLIVNAFQAMPRGGRVELGLRREKRLTPNRVEAPERETICLYVLDEGNGIPEENLPQIFDPFFTTKDVGEGTGLGLSIAYGIIQEHGGWIEVESEPGKGSRFSIYLPPEENANGQPDPDRG